MNFKTYHIHNMWIACETINEENIDKTKMNSLVVFTAAGTFIGQLPQVNENGEFIENTNIVVKLVQNLSDSLLKDIDPSEIPKNDGYFFLENVKFYAQSNPRKCTILPFIQIFSDQVISISIGDLVAFK